MRNQGNGSMGPNTGRFVQALALAGAVLLICGAAFPQANTGRIMGNVTDQSGGAIVGATVQVTDVATNVTRTLSTDDAGAYNAPNLTPSTYKIDVTYMGFRSVERADVVLEVGKELRADFSLQPGEQTQKITVTEALPMVETTNAVLGGTLQPGTIQDLPLNGRNFMNLLQLRPGISIYPGGGAWTQTTNGLRPEENVYLLDGITTIEIFSAQSTINSVSLSGDAATVLPVDTIQEFNTQENPKAEFGWKPGAIVNIALKSGTNAIHGSASAYGRTDALDAQNPFIVSGLPKQPVDLKEFGGSVGGPLKKDKVFFYGAYEGQRYDVGNPVQQSFGTTAGAASAWNTSPILAPSGDIESAAQACQKNIAGGITNSPTSLALAGVAVNGGVCSAIPGAYSVFLNSLPDANGNFLFDFPTLFNTNTGIGKIDWHGNKSTFNAKFFEGQDTGTAVNSSNISQSYWVPDVSAYSYALGGDWTYTPSSAYVNEARFGYTRFTQSFLTADCPGSPGAPNYAATGVSLINAPPNCGMMGITIQSLNGAIGCCSTFPKFYGPDQIYEWADSLSYLKGKHAFKFGGNFNHTVMGNAGTDSHGRGAVSFLTTEAFLAGTVSASGDSVLIGNPRRHVSDDWISAFFQDDWRMTQRVTVNLGIRYEYITPYKEEFNRLANFDASAGLEQVGNQITQPWNPDPNNFSPRAGFAWDVRGDGKTVVRGGGSLIYVTPPMWSFFSQQSSTNPTTGLNSNPAGFLLCNGAVGTTPGTCAAGVNGSTPGTLATAGLNLTPYVNTTGGASVGQVNWNQCTAAGISTFGATPLCAGGGIYGGAIYPSSNSSGVLECGTNRLCTVQSTDPNLREAYVEQWSLGVQRQITNNIALDVEYVGNHGLKLLGQVAPNDPPLGAGWGLVCPPGSGVPCSSTSTTGPLNTCWTSLTSGTAKTASCTPSATDVAALRPLVNNFPWLSYDWEMANLNWSHYDGLQTTLTQRPWHGFGYTAAFTWAHGLDTGGTDRGGGLNAINGDPAANYGAGVFDLREHFTFVTTYALPGRKGFAQSLEGWKVNAIVNLQSALPWDVVDGSANQDPSGVREGLDRWNFYGNSGDFSNLGNQGVPFYPGTVTNGGGNLVPNPGLPQACVNAANALNASPTNQTGTMALYEWGCYMKGSSILIPPAFGTYGSPSPVTFRGVPVKLVDFSILKDWKFNERFNGEFRFEVFNLFNHTTYANPGNNNTSAEDNPYTDGSSFGASQLTPDVANNNPQLGSGAARSIQLGFRLLF